MKRKYKLVLTITPLMVALDQFTKWAVTSHMHLGETIPVIPGFLSWHYLTNEGAAFGMFGDMGDGFRAPFFLVVSLLAVGVVLYYLAKSEDYKMFFPVCLSFVLAGAIGNLADRIRLGHVVDFILVEAGFLGDGAVSTLDKWLGTHYWPSFNVADTLIVIGIIGMAVDLIFFTPVEEKKPEKEADAEASEETDGNNTISADEENYRTLSFTRKSDELE